MLSNTYQNRYEHLRKIIEQHGGASEVARKLEVSKQYVSNLCPSEGQPARRIGDKTARKIESTFGLALGSIDQTANISKPEQDERTVNVPMLNVIVSMGAGAIAPWEEEVMQNVRVSKQWIRQNTQATSFDRLAIITAKGDSMEPTFSDGSTLLIDTSITSIKLDAVYVLARSEELFVKRIQRNIDGSVRIISDNPMYAAQVVDDPIKAGLLVFGRVLLAWNIKKL